MTLDASNDQVTREVASLEEFREGMRFFMAGNYEVAAVFFSDLLESHCVLPEETAICRSWHGLALALNGDAAGVVQCRIACREAGSRPPLQLLLNLARAEQARGDHGRMMQVLEQAIRLYPEAPLPRELHARHERRRPVAIPFLSRDHALNRWLGRWRSRRNRGRTVVSSSAESAG